MEINQPRSNDAVGVQNFRARGQRDVRAGGEDAAVLEEDGALVDDSVGHDEGSGERDGRLLGMRGEGKKEGERAEQGAGRISHAWVRVYRRV